MIAPLTCEPVSVSLKQFTALSHKELEEILLSKLSQIKSIEDYKNLLHCFYGYFRPLEQKISNYITVILLPDIQYRRKSDLILEDLSTENIPELCLSLPSINTISEAIGALYVLEGSTLGGRGITKMLLKNCSFLTGRQLTFFNGYGEQTGNKWTAFLQFINAYPFSDFERQNMLHTADDTFAFFKSWIHKTLY